MKRFFLPGGLCLLSIAILLSGVLMPLLAASQPAPVIHKAELHPSQGKIVGILRNVADRLAREDPPLDKRASSTLAQHFSSPLVKVDQHARLHVYVELTAVDTEILDHLTAYQLEIELVNEEWHIVQGWLPFDRLGALAANERVLRIRPPDYAIGRIGSVTTEGDSILGALEARNTLGVDGSGVRVGVISIGSEGLAAAQASGDVPANVQVLSPSTSCDIATVGISCAEGTAMLEIVYDLAPGATLGFCGAQTGLEMFVCVATLAEDFNADIIVDDIGLFSEPYFEDGAIALVVAAVAARGVVYISSAGNDADNNHYEADFTGALVSTVELHDFGVVAGGNSDTDMVISVAAGQSITIILQWNDPFSSSGNDYDLLLRNAQNEILGISEETQDGDDSPLEAVEFTNSLASSTFVFVQIRKFSGADRRIEMFIQGGVEAIEYPVAAGSIFGHPAVPGVIATAAVDAAEPGNDAVEAFSSQGPADIFFPAFQRRLKPEVAAIDNVLVTGAAGFSSPFPGTSASAPHVAGIAALMRQAAPNISTAQIKTALMTTAQDIESPGFDLLSGTGLVDAVDAVQAASAMTPFPLGVLENPSPSGSVSGIGLISGWVCAALQVVIEIDGTSFPAAYGTSRGDTIGPCGDTDNGFALVTNWNFFGNGPHTVRLLVDSIEFATLTVTVTTLGQEFLTGASGVYTLPDFPQSGSSVAIAWQQSLQNFVLIGQAGSGGGSNGSPPTILDNPPAGAPVSGVGLISGWVCTALSITIEIDGTPFGAAYGTGREDTRSICGDANNGFGLLINWNLFGAGVRTVRAFADGVEFANVSVVVTTLGVEFLTGVSGVYLLPNFPQPGQNVTVQWEQSAQNFIIVGFAGS